MVVVIALVAVPNLPCQAPGGDECAPPDDAIELVPGDSLAYLHADTDPDTSSTRTRRRSPSGCRS